MTNKPITHQAHGLTDSGFTLIEIVVGMALFAVAMLGIGSLSHTTSKMAGCSKMFTEATYEAGQALERLYSAQYSASGGSQDGVDPYLHEKPPAQWHMQKVGSEDKFELRYRVVDDAVLRDTKSVQINVDYACGGTDNQSVQKNGQVLTMGKNKSVQIVYLLPMRQ